MEPKGCALRSERWTLHAFNYLLHIVNVGGIVALSELNSTQRSPISSNTSLTTPTPSRSLAK